MGPARAPSGVIELFDALAADYAEHFANPLRDAYDRLAWEVTLDQLPAPGPSAAPIIDVGCGTGRWARGLIDGGHRVIGLEPSPAMAGAARRALDHEARFELIEAGVEEAEVAEASASAIIAMGSLQYATDPASALERVASWLEPGGIALVLVDSLVSLCAELARDGDTAAARERSQARRGVWEQRGRRAELALFDATSLGDAARSAGLVDVEVRGLLVGFTLLGREGLTTALEVDPGSQMDRERGWSSVPCLADLGKQLLLTARHPRALGP